MGLTINFEPKTKFKKKYFLENFTKRIILKTFEKTVNDERWTVNGGR